MTITIKSNPDGVSGAIQVNGVDAVTVDKTGIIQGAPFSFRNKIINGDMRIDQRNGGASVTPGSGSFNYLLDRFGVYLSQASKLTVQQNAGSITPPTGFANYLGITSSSAYVPLASDTFVLQQRIEGFNVGDLAFGTASAKTLTLSFRVYSSLTGTFAGAITNGTPNRSYPFTYSIPSANTWTTVSITIPGDISGTWAKNNTVGMQVCFNLGCGSNAQGTPNSWNASNYQSVAGTVNVISTNAATFYITGVQLEAGSIATPFEHRPYGMELSLCQRYYENAPFALSESAATNGGSPTFYIYNKEVKRAPPSSVVETTSDGGGVSSFTLTGYAEGTTVLVSINSTSWYRQGYIRVNAEL